MAKIDTATERLNRFNIKPSHQRLMIMEYMLTHYTHPSVEEIYQDMVADMPTLSKTTVYNTMKIFAQQGAVVELNIDEKNLCFDGNITPHVHFMCKDCGDIHDVWLDSDSLLLPNLKNFTVTESQHYLKGYCKCCSKKRPKIA